MILTRASQWVGLVYVTRFHLNGVLSHRRRQSCSGLSLTSTTQASIRRVPDPGYKQPLKLDAMSSVERFTVTLFPRTYLISNVLVPRLAIVLIPIDHPKAVDVGGALDIPTSMRLCECDVLDLGWHVHARIHIGPVFRNVLQCPAVLAFPIGMTIWRRRDGVPECAVGSTNLAGHHRLTGLSPVGDINRDEGENDEEGESNEKGDRKTTTRLKC